MRRFLLCSLLSLSAGLATAGCFSDDDWNIELDFNTRRLDLSIDEAPDGVTKVSGCASDVPFNIGRGTCVNDEAPVVCRNDECLQLQGSASYEGAFAPGAVGSTYRVRWHGHESSPHGAPPPPDVRSPAQGARVALDLEGGQTLDPKVRFDVAKSKGPATEFSYLSSCNDPKAYDAYTKKQTSYEGPIVWELLLPDEPPSGAAGSSGAGGASGQAGAGGATNDAGAAGATTGGAAGAAGAAGVAGAAGAGGAGSGDVTTYWLYPVSLAAPMNLPADRTCHVLVRGRRTQRYDSTVNSERVSLEVSNTGLFSFDVTF